MKKNSLLKILSFTASALLFLALAGVAFYDDYKISRMEAVIDTGELGEYHIQGVALDKKNGYLYYSYTDKIVKSDLNGNIIGSITGFKGHIGCIAFNEEDGRVYASLEYKHDEIGKVLIDNVEEARFEDGFYIAAFDVDRILTGDYEASKYPSMIKTVYLKEVLKDYKGEGRNLNGDTVEHKYGCSGIDGLCIAPLPGQKNKKMYLYVAYGIYSDKNRGDNDNQVILCYDIDDLSRYEAQFNQAEMLTDGPEAYEYKFFVYTGNTTYGIQNMAYDEEENMILMAAYPGAKETFDNYSLFAVDLTESPAENKIKGTGEKGMTLSLKEADAESDKEISGWYTKTGQCGMCSVGNGHFYLAESIDNNGRFSAKLYLNKFDTENGFQPVAQ